MYGHLNRSYCAVYSYGFVYQLYKVDLTFDLSASVNAVFKKGCNTFLRCKGNMTANSDKQLLAVCLSGCVSVETWTLA